MEKVLAGIVVLGVVIVGALFFMQDYGEVPGGPEAAPVETAAKERTFAWRFEFRESEGALPPSTHVALITNGEVYDLGRYAGSCAEIADDQLLENEVAAVLCWWAGGGDELGVFKEGDRYVVKQGIQEEGTAEGLGQRGDFQELITLQ